MTGNVKHNVTSLYTTCCLRAFRGFSFVGAVASDVPFLRNVFLIRFEVINLFNARWKKENKEWSTRTAIPFWRAYVVTYVYTYVLDGMSAVGQSDEHGSTMELSWCESEGAFSKPTRIPVAPKHWRTPLVLHAHACAEPLR